MKKKSAPRVGVIMGSESDLKVMQKASDCLTEFGIAHETRIISAHRTPEAMLEYAQTAEKRGLKVIIAGAGGAAHLPGMVASATSLPVIGVPVNVTALDGIDAVMSILQMPKGVPVATVAVDGSFNAGLLAARILGISDSAISARLTKFKTKQKSRVLETDRRVKKSAKKKT
jgi:5-(carboxyamino)imidazole ribonucleotide mutase